MATQTIRTGRIMLVAGYRQGGDRPGQQPVYRDYPVKQHDDGSVYFYLGPELARSPDGWVELDVADVARVQWSD